MLICFTKGIATAEEEPPKAAPNMKLIPGFMPNTSQPNNPIAANVKRKFTIVKVTVSLMESAKVLNDNSVPLSNKRITSVSCPKILPIVLNFSASMSLNNGPIMMPINISNNTSGILFLTEKEAPVVEEDPCINCGRCIKACPSILTPVLMNKALIANDIEEAKRYGLMDCIECGSCAWICPAHIKLTQRFRIGKNIVRTEMAKNKNGGK
jgi:NAD-dependent dihydropyrimidine dehydrogenase PreA subunit